MVKSPGKSDRMLMAGAIAGLAAVRLIPIPRPLLLLMVAIIGLLVLWLGGRALIRRRREKREDRQAAWNRFVRDRTIP